MIHTCARSHARGFTLTDLMISVAIVGVLSTVAYVAYHKLVNTSHMAEATNILADIKTRQERFKAETGQYLSVSKGLGVGSSVGSFAYLYPQCVASESHPGASKVAWGGTCPSACCDNQWDKLQVDVHGAVYYGYSTVAGAAGGQVPAVSIGGHSVAWPTPGGPWFVASAVGDTDKNGVYATAILTSFDNELRFDKENE